MVRASFGLAGGAPCPDSPAPPVMRPADEGSVQRSRPRASRAKRRTKVLQVVGLAIVLLGSHLQFPAGADECEGEIRKVIDGDIHLKSTAETKETKKVKGADLRMPLCVLEVLKKGRRYRIRFPDEPGEWLIKRRYVLETDGGLDSRPKITPSRCDRYSLPGYPIGGIRGSGEEPCK